MSISYDAVLVFGLPYSEIENAEELTDDSILDLIWPYYDASPIYCLAGITVLKSDLYDLVDIPSISKEVEIAAIKFKEITGLDGKLYLSSFVC